MSPMTHQDSHVYAITVNNNHNTNNMDEFYVVVSHSLTIISLHIYLTFTGICMYAIGLFSQVTCAPESISTSLLLIAIHEL